MNNKYNFLNIAHFGGIYQIQSQIKPERIYIGSAVDFAGRWRVHIRDLRNNKHHSIKLQRHYNKYGETDLVFIPILCCPNDVLYNTEDYFINKLKPYFNISKGAWGCLGVVPSMETRKKQSLAKMGKKKPPMPQETRDKLSIALVGNKNGKGNKNKIRTPEIRKKYSDATKAFFNTPKGREQAEKNRITSTGIKQSPETITKRMEKLKVIYSNPDYEKKKSDAMKSKPRQICEYCGKDCNFTEYHIHHGRRCRSNNNIVSLQK